MIARPTWFLRFAWKIGRRPQDQLGFSDSLGKSFLVFQRSFEKPSCVSPGRPNISLFVPSLFSQFLRHSPKSRNVSINHHSARRAHVDLPTSPHLDSPHSFTFHLSPLPSSLSSHFDLLISMPIDITTLPALPALPMDADDDDSAAAAESDSVNGDTGEHYFELSMAAPFVPPTSGCAAGRLCKSTLPLGESTHRCNNCGGRIHCLLLCGKSLSDAIIIIGSFDPWLLWPLGQFNYRNFFGEERRNEMVLCSFILIAFSLPLPFFRVSLAALPGMVMPLVLSRVAPCR